MHNSAKHGGMKSLGRFVALAGASVQADGPAKAC